MEIYLDNGATTRVDPQVADLARRTMEEAYGNPSSAHRLGAQAARALAGARAQVAAALGATPAEVTFTSGGTEANALALGAVGARQAHVVISGFEHPSVLEAARALVARGVEVTTVAPNQEGVVEAAAFAAAVRAETALAACLWVQNEIGTVQPIAAIARAVKALAPRCHVHVDAVQALGKLPIEVGELGCDSLALSAHKLHGPKGVGALWLRRGAHLPPLWQGGGQERQLRPGTENMPGAVAFGLAAEQATAALPEAAPRMASLRDQLWQRIAAALPLLRRHGDPSRAAPHILSVGFPGVPAEPLLHALEERGVYVSAGSACHAKDKRPSTTLTALGLPADMGTLRFSLSRLTTAEEVTAAAAAVVAAVEALS